MSLLQGTIELRTAIIQRAPFCRVTTKKTLSYRESFEISDRITSTSQASRAPSQAIASCFMDDESQQQTVASVTDLSLEPPQIDPPAWVPTSVEGGLGLDRRQCHLRSLQVTAVDESTKARKAGASLCAR